MYKNYTGEVNSDENILDHGIGIFLLCFFGLLPLKRRRPNLHQLSTFKGGVLEKKAKKKKVKKAKKVRKKKKKKLLRLRLKRNNFFRTK